MSTSNLNGIQFMTKAQYDAVRTKDAGTIYCVETPVVIESYVNGVSWYRKWSDGWVEQAGNLFAATGGWTSGSATFLVPFVNTNFTLEVFGNWSDAGSSSTKVTAISTTGFTATIAVNLLTTSGVPHWYACGYFS